jgi:hypothetical protein
MAISSCPPGQRASRRPSFASKGVPARSFGLRTHEAGKPLDPRHAPSPILKTAADSFQRSVLAKDSRIPFQNNLGSRVWWTQEFQIRARLPETVVRLKNMLIMMWLFTIPALAMAFLFAAVVANEGFGRFVLGRRLRLPMTANVRDASRTKRPARRGR